MENKEEDSSFNYLKLRRDGKKEGEEMSRRPKVVLGQRPIRN
jgi:hypothetical protein